MNEYVKTLTPDYTRKALKNYYQKNKDQIIAKQKKYNDEHKDNLKLINEKSYLKKKTIRSKTKLIQAINNEPDIATEDKQLIVNALKQQLIKLTHKPKSKFKTPESTRKAIKKYADKKRLQKLQLLRQQNQIIDINQINNDIQNEQPLQDDKIQS